jgi:hypothetical protein
MKMLMTVYAIMLLITLYVFTAEAQDEVYQYPPRGPRIYGNPYTPNVVPNQRDNRGMVVNPISAYEVDKRRERRRHIEQLENDYRNRSLDEPEMTVCRPRSGGGQTCHSF